MPQLESVAFEVDRLQVGRLQRREVVQRRELVVREVDQGNLKQNDIAYVKNVILAIVDTKSKRVVSGRNGTGWSCSSQMLFWKGCRLAMQTEGQKQQKERMAPRHIVKILDKENYQGGFFMPKIITK